MVESDIWSNLWSAISVVLNIAQDESVVLRLSVAGVQFNLQFAFLMPFVCKQDVQSAYEPIGSFGRRLIWFSSYGATTGEVFLLPPGWDTSPLQGYRGERQERGTMRVKFLDQEHGGVPQSGLKTWFARSVLQRILLGF